LKASTIKESVRFLTIPAILLPDQQHASMPYPAQKREDFTVIITMSSFNQSQLFQINPSIYKRITKV